MIAKFGTFEYALAERYRFEDELGRGAMGVVYRATDVRLGRPVAIKLLHPALTNELGVARFESEIRIAAGLHHPNIVGVHDSGESDGRLFYVMDYLGGETLRARLEREKQLSVDDALSIVEQVAAGLQYAHDHGIVHRDVKPENILVVDGRASIMDFGLARALSGMDAQRLTASGLAVGTPHYLSPEQASAEKEVGPKADQYALACVLYELLAGEPPFTGPTASAIAMRHIAEQPAPLRMRRKAVSIDIENAVLRAMEKVPGDRYQHLSAFASALLTNVGSAAGSATIQPRDWRPRAYVGIALLLTGIGVVGAVAAAHSRSSIAQTLADRFSVLLTAQLDSNRYIVMPLQPSEAREVVPAWDDQLRDALAQWEGVSVARSAEAATGTSGGPIPRTPAEERSTARALRSAHYVELRVTRWRSGQRLRADVFATNAEAPPRSVVVDIENGANEAGVAALAFKILFQPAKGADAAAAAATRSLTALRAYYRAMEWVGTWNLIAADSTLATALHADQSFPQALLALAQVRAWMRDDAPDVQSLLARAAAGAAQLSTRQRLHTAALQALEVGRFRDACEGYGRLVGSDSSDFGAWYGLGECNRRDRAVERNSGSPSGMSFRASRHRAIVALGRAFALLPRVDACCVERADQVERRSLIVSASRIVAGRGVAPDSSIYGAYPGLNADTLTLVPYPMNALSSAVLTSRTAAVREQRKLFLEIAARRVAAYPNNADALEELGEAMELRGDRATVDTIMRATAVATDTTQRLRLAVTRVWLRLKLALPGSTAELAKVRTVADSLLAQPPRNPKEFELLAGLAAVFSPAEVAARMAESGEQQQTPFPVGDEVLGSARALLVYAARGGPVDSLRDVEARLLTGISNQVASDRQEIARELLVGQSASLSFSTYRGDGFARLDPASNDLVAAEAAYAKGDAATVRRILSRLATTRLHTPPADVTLDAIYPEAWLLASIGDTTHAIQLIAPTLDGARDKGVREWSDIANAGVLLRLMALRARLSYGRGNRNDARLWARAAIALIGRVQNASMDGTPPLAAIAH